MKKVNIAKIIISVVLMVVTGMLIYQMVEYNRICEEGEDLERRLGAITTISDEYGVHAAQTYIEVDNEFTENGGGGIGTYEFEYWGDTLRMNAESVDGNLSTSRPVE